MSIRQTLLAILDQGPRYGSQLRAEYERRTGAVWPLNAGQLYSTLDRLERDGLVTRADADAQGHIYFAITPAGSAEAAAWLSTPDPGVSVPRDELAIKIAVALTLPGVDGARVVEVHLAAARARADELTRRVAGAETGADAAALANTVALDALAHAASAEAAWLSATAERLRRRGDTAIPLSDPADAPRRGRPSRTARS